MFTCAESSIICHCA